MSTIIERCAGIDIGKRFLLCCVPTGAADEEQAVTPSDSRPPSLRWNGYESGCENKASRT
jgi:hypothetical protein